nr:flavin reductase family protein [Sphingobium sp. EM0848]
MMSAYPTGVSDVTATDDEGRRRAMVVGSLTSISLSPPLIGFFPDKMSTSWPPIGRAGRFCVNILGTHQLDLCDRFAVRAEDKFAGLVHGFSPSGQPLLDEVVAWMDCAIDRVIEIGDHWLVVGAVEAMGRSGDRDALLFHRGSYVGVAGKEAR